MKEKIDDLMIWGEMIMESSIMPVVCVLLIVLVDELLVRRWKLSGACILELVLAIAGVVSIVRSYEAGLIRIICLLLCAVSILCAGIDTIGLFRKQSNPVTTVSGVQDGTVYGSGSESGSTGSSLPRIGRYPALESGLDTTCTLCDGAGKVKCIVCNGSGVNEMYEDLSPVMKGFSKPYCEGCYGEGSITCGRCHGSGQQ